MLTFLIVLALIFNFLNGFNDSSNIVATIIFSRAMHPRVALWLTAIAEFVGPFLFGVAVAKTIGAGIVDPTAATPEVIVAALCSAILWNIFTWFMAIPSSSSHALVGGLVGAVWASAGLATVQTDGVIKVLLALFLSPILGFAAGFLITRLIFFLARSATMRINWWFKRGQVLTGLVLALSHGANDAQKSMGIITLGLVAAGQLSEFEVPFWVIVSSAAAMSLGTSLGAWRLIKTLGGKFFKIRPVDGFATQISAASVILGAALLGGPASTTQVVSSSILGVGTAERPNKVRWGVAGSIAATWLLTIPANVLLAWALYWLIRLIMG